MSTESNCFVKSFGLSLTFQDVWRYLRTPHGNSPKYRICNASIYTDLNSAIFFLRIQFINVLRLNNKHRNIHSADWRKTRSVLRRSECCCFINSLPATCNRWLNQRALSHTSQGYIFYNPLFMPVLYYSGVNLKKKKRSIGFLRSKDWNGNEILWRYA